MPIAIAVAARLVRLLLPWLLLGWAVIGANTVAADESITVEAAWDGDFVAVSANANLPVEAATAWSVLTDFDHFSRFIPDLVAMRIVSRSPNGMVVDYEGAFSFLFFRLPMHLLLDVVMEPPRRILARSLSGDLQDLSSSYEIHELPQALRLTYKARFLPAYALPPFIVLAFVRHEVEKQFTAMVNEIVRRGTAQEHVTTLLRKWSTLEVAATRRRRGCRLGRVVRPMLLVALCGVLAPGRARADVDHELAALTAALPACDAARLCLARCC